MKGVAVVAGAGSGEGPQISRALAEAGYDLLLITQPGQPIAGLQSQLTETVVSASITEADLQAPAELRRVVEREKRLVDRIAVLVCNCAPQYGNPGCQLCLDPLDSGFIGYSSMQEIIRSTLPIMVRRRHGRIVLVAPIHSGAETEGLFKLRYGCTPSSMLTRRLAEEVGRSRITVNSIAGSALGENASYHSIREQARYLGLPSAGILKFIAGSIQCPCDSITSQTAQMLKYLLRPEADTINGLVLALPQLRAQAAA